MIGKGDMRDESSSAMQQKKTNYAMILIDQHCERNGYQEVKCKADKIAAETHEGNRQRTAG